MKGILFRPEMLPLIKNGSKTVTRRIMKLNLGFGWELPSPIVSDEIFKENLKALNLIGQYKVGEVVYIKEAHRFVECDGNLNDFGVEYKDGDYRLWRDNAEEMNYPINSNWRSPMFMPAGAARYFIQITDVRPERLQEITVEDIIAEGILPPNKYGWLPDVARLKFQLKWDSINPKYPYSSNHWCFRYEFKKVER